MTPTSHHDDGHLYEDEFLHNEDVAHEHTDVPLPSLIMYLVGLAGTCIVCAIIVWGMFRYFERAAAQNDPQVSPLAIPAGQLPPTPRLVTNEPAVLKKQHAIENETLKSYGWVDKPGGAARLPIDEAKKKLLQHGLPTRPDAVSEPWMGTNAPSRGESSSGRAIPAEHKGGH